MSGPVSDMSTAGMKELDMIQKEIDDIKRLETPKSVSVELLTYTCLFCLILSVPFFLLSRLHDPSNHILPLP